MRTAVLCLALVAPATVPTAAHASHNVSAWISVGPTIPDSTAPTGQATLVEVGAASSKACNLWEFDISGTIPAQITIQDNTTFKTVVAKATYSGYISGSVLCRAGNGLDIATASFGPVKVEGLATLPFGFLQEDKQFLNQYSNGLWIGTGVLAIAGAIVAAIACPPCAAIALVIGATSGALAIEAGAYGIIASDPPDPNYTQLATPVPLPVPTFTANAASQLTDAEALTANELLANVSDSTGLARALLTSMERAWGAYNAQDATWQNRQLVAAKGFATRLADDLTRAQNLRSGFVTAIDADPRVPTTSIAPGVPTAIAGLVSGGLPPAMVQELTNGGVSPADQAASVLPRVLIEAFNQTTLGGKLSSALAIYTPTATDEGQVATTMKTFAGTPTLPVLQNVAAPAPGRFAVGALHEAVCLTWATTPAVGCQHAHALYDAAFTVISPDGRNAYVASRLGSAIAAFARNPVTGRLTQLTGKAACVAQPSNQADAACAVGWGIDAVSQLAMSRDGRYLYSAARQSSAVAVYRRTAKGGLVFVQCLANRTSDAAAHCKGVVGLSDAQGVAVTPDGRSVYVTGGGDRMITAFSRNAKNGKLAYRSCVTSRTDHPECGLVVALDGANRVAVSKDSRYVYATAESDNAVVEFSRTPQGDLHQIGCIGGNYVAPVAACSTARGIVAPQSLSLSPDGSNLYVTAGYGVAVLTRSATTGLLTQAADATGCVASNQHYDSSCTLATGLESPFGIVVTPDGQAVYVGAYNSNAVTMFARSLTTGALRQVYTCVSFDATGCRHGAGLDHVGWVTTSPDGRFVYADAPHSNAVVMFQRKLPAVPPKTAAKAKLNHGRTTLVLACPVGSIAGCYGVMTAYIAGKARPAVRYTIAAGRKGKVALVIPGGKATTVRVVFTALEPSGGHVRRTVKIKVA
ncbi:hypothetical protein acdb102_19680 [Acidothermaceae bacterium B102]|nr:hypothetical protein acdb102_19680 [Acidothermaceae bacterium B102]